MKKIIATILTGILVMGLAACGNTAKTTSTESKGTNTKTENVPKDNASQNAASDNQTEKGKVLVVYYSATGNTKTVANAIAEETGGSTFEIVPVDTYSNEDLDWTKNNSRVSAEHNNPNNRNVKLTEETVDNWEEYDTVFIGYPIWWGIAAWPVDTFIKANNFTGKTVIPFCTAASSGMGESGELLEKMAGTGTWLEGERFGSGVTADTVKEWVRGLGL